MDVPEHTRWSLPMDMDFAEGYFRRMLGIPEGDLPEGLCEDLEFLCSALRVVNREPGVGDLAMLAVKYRTPQRVEAASLPIVKRGPGRPRKEVMVNG